MRRTSRAISFANDETAQTLANNLRLANCGDGQASNLCCKLSNIILDRDKYRSSSPLLRSNSRNRLLLVRPLHGSPERRRGDQSVRRNGLAEREEEEVTHGGIERAAKTSNSRLSLKKEKIRAAPPKKRCTSTLNAKNTHGYRSKGVHPKCGQYTKVPQVFTASARFWPMGRHRKIPPAGATECASEGNVWWFPAFL